MELSFFRKMVVVAGMLPFLAGSGSAVAQEGKTVPAPAWLTAPDTRSDLNAADLEERRKENLMFGAFDFNSVPEDEYGKWRERWKRRCHVQEEHQFRMVGEPLAMLVRLRDAETVDWLVDQMGQGQGRTSDAGHILGASGQEWLLPRIEPFIFLKPENEPPNESTGCVIYQPVSGVAFRTFRQIVENSTRLTPRVKSWLTFLCDDAWDLDDRQEIMDLLAKWWDMNRARMDAGDYRHLSVVPLWPDAEVGEEVMDLPYSLPDFIAALGSEREMIRLAALKAIQSRKLQRGMYHLECSRVAEFLKAENSSIRTNAYRVLAGVEERGEPFIQAVFPETSPETPGYVAADRLARSPSSPLLRAWCIRQIVDGGGWNICNSKPGLGLESYPFLRKLVLSGSVDDRASTIAYCASCATSADLGVFHELTADDQPENVRGAAFRAIVSLCSEDKLPEDIRALAETQPFNTYFQEIRAAADRRSKVRLRPRFVLRSKGELQERYEDLLARDLFTGHQSAYELAGAGEPGMVLLKKAMETDRVPAKANAARVMMEAGMVPAGEEDRYLRAIIQTLGTTDDHASAYFWERKELRGRFLPLLKERIVDSFLDAEVRRFAAAFYIQWSEGKDPVFLKSLLGSAHPANVRWMAVIGVFRFLPPEEARLATRELAADKEFSEAMKLYGYLDVAE